jgi:hypothetical protein
VTEFARALDTLEIKQRSAAQWFRTSERSIRRWKSGARKTPPAVGIVLRLLAAKAITIDQIEQAAVSAPAQTNGHAKPEPPAPLEPLPAPKQSTSARAKTATPADPGPTIAELDRDACRWPVSTPGRSDFYFCGRLIAKGSYCQPHYNVAHTAQPLPKARSGFRPGVASAGSLAPAGVRV